MADGSAAEAAYQRALREIERVRAEGGKELVLSGDGFAQLDRIPPELIDLAGLRELKLDQTAVSDLGALAGLTKLRRLDANDTALLQNSAV